MTDQQKSFLAANWFKLFIVVVTVLLILFYFERESRLDSCLSNATGMYSKEWDSTCSREGKSKNCTLPKYLADSVNAHRDTYVNECYRRYSFK